LEEKDRFVTELYSRMNQEFTYEHQKNSLMGSIRRPVTFLLQTLIFGGGLSWLAYYMETTDEYSFRIPAILYFLVAIMEYVGYIPVVMVTGAISLCILIWVVKNMIRPTKKLVIERNI
jgi:hypothetical protein